MYLYYLDTICLIGFSTSYQFQYYYAIRNSLTRHKATFM